MRVFDLLKRKEVKEMTMRIVGDDHLELCLQRGSETTSYEVELYFLFLELDASVWGKAITEDSIVIGKLDDRILVLSKSQIQKVLDLAPIWTGEWWVYYRHHTVPFREMGKITIEGSQLHRMALMLDTLNEAFLTVFPHLKFKI